MDSLRAFQASVGLPQTGQPDSQTITALTPAASQPETSSH
jgi:peptidoglycan hydrolase-like protein with peptidoglycan-binding domain